MPQFFFGERLRQPRQNVASKPKPRLGAISFSLLMKFVRRWNVASETEGARFRSIQNSIRDDKPFPVRRGRSEAQLGLDGHLYATR